MDRAWFGPRGRGKRATTRVQNRAAHAPDDRRGLRPRDCTKGRQAQQRADQSGRSPRRITESHSSQTLAREQIAATAATVATRVVHRHGVAAQRFSNHAPAVTSATRSAGGATAAPRSRPSRAEPSRAEPSRAEPSRAEPSRAEPSRNSSANLVAGSAKIEKGAISLGRLFSPGAYDRRSLGCRRARLRRTCCCKNRPLRTLSLRHRPRWSRNGPW
jgi:hypothetical protein